MQAYSLSRLQRSLCNSTLLRMYHHERMLVFLQSCFDIQTASPAALQNLNLRLVFVINIEFRETFDI